MVIDMTDWDKIIITVGTEQQKYFILNRISNIEFLDKENIAVVSDGESGIRIGSGGAFINVISKFSEPGQKILVINSGGYSKRCINYSVKGKLFCTFYYENKIATLLESIIVQTSAIAKRIKSGALVCCSDILTIISEADLDRFDFDNNTGFCIRRPLDECSRHGAFICDNNQKVMLYAHKKSISQLKEMTLSESALIDTGMIFFSDEFLNKMRHISNENNLISLINDNAIELNLYPEIVALFAEKKEKDCYLSEDLQNEAHLKMRNILWNTFSSMRAKVFEIDAKEFLHFGTVSESADNIRFLSNDEKFISINSIVNENCSFGDKVILENCFLDNCVVGESVFVSDIMLSNVKIPDNTLVCGIKTADGKCVTMCCPIDENPKKMVEGEELWKRSRFCPLETFSESFDGFINGTAEKNKLSMEQITQNADVDYFISWPLFLKNLNYCSSSEKYLKRRNEILKHYFDDLRIMSELEFKNNFIEIKMPLRLNLSGTWTDAMPYCVDNGGQVINMSVKVDGNLPVYVSLKMIDDPIIIFISDNRKVVYHIQDECDCFDGFDDFILHKSVLKVLGITAGTSVKHGFCLETRVNGIKKGSGLGTSSLLLLGCFTAFEKALGLAFSEAEKSNMVFVAEQVMKTGGGWQDQICGLSYGINRTTTESGIRQHISIKKLSDSQDFQRVINDRFAIVYTGQRHYGRFIVYEIMNKYLDGDYEICQALNELKKLNNPMEKAIENRDINKIASLLNEQFALLKKLSRNITNEQIDKIVEFCRTFSDGVCICGAGAGGYLMVVLKENTDFEEVKKQIKSNFPGLDDITASRISLYKG